MHTLLMSVHYEHVSNIAFDAVHCKYVVICVIVLIIVHIQESQDVLYLQSGLRRPHYASYVSYVTALATAALVGSCY